MAVPARMFPVPVDEEERLRSLTGFGVIGAPPLSDLPSVVELAAYVCGVPNAVVNLISATEQHQIAAVGFEPGVCAREDSMCAVSIVEPRPVMVPDARVDPRFADNPFVSGEIDRIRFYASSQLRDRNGHVLGALCVFDREPHELSPPQRAGLDKLARMVMDVLELHRHGRLLHDALETVQRTSQELVRSNTALRQFAGQVSHDLNNPLTGVLGFVGMLGDSPSVRRDPQARHCVDRALSSATRMRRMIEDVLAYASVGGRSSFAQVRLDDLAASVLDELYGAITAAGVTVHIGPLPVVIGDAALLRVLLLNLLSNAVKFRDPGRAARIDVRGEEHATGWSISVADNGVGIPVADRARVCELFTRLHPQIEGSGIGLATCQRIAEAHGARLSIGDNPGGGTTVRITLPR